MEWRSLLRARGPRTEKLGTFSRRASLDSTTASSHIDDGATDAATKEENLPPAHSRKGTKLNGMEIKKATRLRKTLVTIASISYLFSFLLYLLVMMGNITDKPVLRSTYFFKLDLSHIIPETVPNAQLINSIAQSIGLHDFYQVALWNFCEGYVASGITHCSKPQSLYWFNPVEILMSELLAGASIALPTQIIQILDILRTASLIMFGFFLASTILTFVLILASSLALRSRWWSVPVGLAALFAALLGLIGSIIGSIISFAFKYAAESQTETLNIRLHLGASMFVFAWMATGLSIWAFFLHAGLLCYCASRRDVRTGRRVLIGGVVQDM